MYVMLPFFYIDSLFNKTNLGIGIILKAKKKNKIK